MQFGVADAVDLGSAFRAGPENDSAAALIKSGGRILDFPFLLAFYTIASESVSFPVFPYTMRFRQYF